MVETRDHFSNRLNKLGRKHTKMTHGYVTKVDKNGLIIVEPKKPRRVGGGSAIKLLMLVAIGFMGFKVFTLASVGPTTYNERLATLQEGTVVEQIGAKALAIDPVTEVVVEKVGPLLR